MSRAVRTAPPPRAEAAASLAGLRSEPLKCGAFQCAADQYCSPHTFSCRPCADLCQPESNNFQQQSCERNCQDYLHQLSYLSKQDELEMTAALSRLEGDVHRLTILVAAMLALFALCCGVAVFYAAATRRHWCRRRRDAADMEKTANGGIELALISDRLANGAPGAPGGPSAISPKSSAAPPYCVGRHCPQFNITDVKPAEQANKSGSARSRHPSEDTLPEDYTYSAVYDNPALSVTPPLAAAGGGATVAHPLSAAALRSRESLRRAGSSASGSVAGSVRTDVTRLPREESVGVGVGVVAARRLPREESVGVVGGGGGVVAARRLPREVDITDLSPQTPVPVT